MWTASPSGSMPTRRCSSSAGQWPRSSSTSSSVGGSPSGSQQGGEPPGEQVGVAGPPGRQVGAVLHHEGVPVVVGGAAPERPGPSFEVGRIIEIEADLVLDIGRVGAVVPAEAPGGGGIGASLQVLGQARGAP